MPAAVGGYLVAAGASEAVGAVAAAVVQGIIIGAIVGGAATVMKGGADGNDIFKGALKGAAVGGVAGGAFSGLSMGLSGLTGGELGATAGEQLAARGVSTAAGAGEQAITTAPSAAATGEATQGLLAPSATGQAAPTAGGTLAEAPAAGQGMQQVGQEPAKKGLLSGMFGPEKMSDAQAKIFAGIGEGAAQGAAGYYQAREEREAQKDLMKSKQQYEQALIARNQPVAFRPPSAQLQFPDWWMNQLNPQTVNPFIGMKPRTGGFANG